MPTPTQDGQSPRWWRPYGVAVAAVTAAALIRWMLPGVLADTPFLAFYPAVVVAAAFGGFGAGVAATLGSCLCYVLWFDPTLQALDAVDGIRLAVFVGGGSGVSVIAHMQQASRRRERQRADALRDSEARLQEINSTLEQRVVDRTAEATHRAELLRALAAQLTNAEQQERHRLAQILHDGLQQQLVSAKFSLHVLQSQLPDGELQEVTRQVDEALNESLEMSRSLTAELSPPVLYLGTFAEALQWLADWMCSKHGLRVQVEAVEDVNPSEDLRILLFQAVRELLFNVVKHAGVDRALVRVFGADGNRVTVTVSDEGVGFDPSASHGVRTDGGGFGLFGIRERISYSGGRLEITSSPGQGTVATINVPLGQAKTS